MRPPRSRNAALSVVRADVEKGRREDWEFPYQITIATKLGQAEERAYMEFPKVP